MTLKAYALASYTFFVAAIVQALDIIFSFSREDMAGYGIFALVCSVISFVLYYKELKTKDNPCF